MREVRVKHLVLAVPVVQEVHLVLVKLRAQAVGEVRTIDLLLPDMLDQMVDPVAAVEESGIQVESHAMSTVVDYKELVGFEELLK